jgi:hypothetical protein
MGVSQNLDRTIFSSPFLTLTTPAKQQKHLPLQIQIDSKLLYSQPPQLNNPCGIERGTQKRPAKPAGKTAGTPFEYALHWTRQAAARPTTSYGRSLRKPLPAYAGKIQNVEVNGDAAIY